MTITLGVNSGFVTVAPTTDPAGTTTGAIDTTARVTKDTSSSTAGKIIEVGWWCNEATQEANFEVGLYAADGVVVPGEAGTRLFVDATNAKGTTSGWKVVSGLDWAISPNTAYWIGVQLDDTATTTTTDSGATTGSGFDVLSGQTTLPNPFGGGALFSNLTSLAFYAVWEVASGPSNLKSYNTNVKSNIKSINGNPIANCKSLNTNV